MRITIKRSVILAVAIALFPSPVLANSLTPVIEAAFVHLLVGNFLLGAVEGFLLSKWFGTPRGNSQAILVVANYASALLGHILLANRLSTMPQVTLENVLVWLWIFVAIAFVLTLLIEYPFFWLLLRKQEKAFRKSLKATIVIHCISYLLLFGWYATSSVTSMANQLDVVPVVQLQPNEEYLLYFISSDGKQVVRSDLEGKQQEIVKELRKIEKNPALFMCKNQEGQIDLVAKEGMLKEIVLSDFTHSLPTLKYANSGFNSPLMDSKNPCYSNMSGMVPKLTENTNWDYQTVFWATRGIMGDNKANLSSFNFGLETPFAWWYVRHATHLEGDYAVFQLGEDGVYILQPQEKKIALITRGRSPVVIKPKR
ncbi:MAG TPA: hypothetical protein IGS17_18195 [Oscillatoriales cyanobacterium M59_W2019_021]|nr:hypothetical protein [Oscillatoriales cyanobacterium M59_W2019_021]